MSNLSFAFEGQEIRFVGTPENPEWVASDIVSILYPDSGKGDRANLLKKIPPKWKGMKTIHTNRGNRSTTTLHEPGLYYLVARSNSEKAIPFQDWLYEEVLPSIRKTGSYSLPQTDMGIPISTEPVAALPADLTDLVRETNKLYGEFEVIFIEPTPALEIAKEIGDRLLKLKEQVGHGNWEEFREENIRSPHTGQPMPSSTATMYQRIAKNWDVLQQVDAKSIRDAIYVLRRDRGGITRLMDSAPQPPSPAKYLEFLREGIELANSLGGFDDYQAGLVKHQILEVLLGV